MEKRKDEGRIDEDRKARYQDGVQGGDMPWNICLAIAFSLLGSSSYSNVREKVF